MSSKAIAVVLFGGLGKRFNKETPKQFFSISDSRTLMGETLSNIANLDCIEEIIVVSHPSFIEKTKDVIKNENLKKIAFVIPGGESREESAYNALCYLKSIGTDEDKIIAICDGDRPNAMESFFQEAINEAKEKGAIVATISTDSLIYDEQGQKYLNRSQVYRVQTPQCFKFKEILEAFEKEKNSLNFYTDEGSIYLKHFPNISIVKGEERNFKITTMDDYKRYLQERKNQ